MPRSWWRVRQISALRSRTSKELLVNLTGDQMEDGHQVQVPVASHSVATRLRCMRVGQCPQNSKPLVPGPGASTGASARTVQLRSAVCMAQTREWKPEEGSGESGLEEVSWIGM